MSGMKLCISAIGSPSPKRSRSRKITSWSSSSSKAPLTRSDRLNNLVVEDLSRGPLARRGEVIEEAGQLDRIDSPSPS